MNGTELLSVGIDVGTSSVKTAIVRTVGEAGGTMDVEVLGKRADRIRRRDLKAVIHECYGAAMDECGLKSSDMAYIASTGEGELVEFRRGHFYGMTTHSRGARFLVPECTAALDVGALHARAMRIGDGSRVTNYRMTSQCASGSGQFLENVARYLGVALEEVGPLSTQAESPEMVSSICAVLAETDVINMVSRGVAIPNILKGIHLSMAGRYFKLLTSVKAEGVVMVTGGLAEDVGLMAALRELSAEAKADLDIRAHPKSVLAGALGAALWGAFRVRKLARQGVRLSGEQG